MLEIKNTATNIKNSFDGLINRLDITEEIISQFEDMSIKTSQTEVGRETIEKNHNRISKNYETITKDATSISEREKGAKDIFEVTMAKNFTKVMADTKPQIQEAQRTPSIINAKKSTPRYILFKPQKTKERVKILKEARVGKGGGETPFLQRNKVKNYIGLLFRIHASKKRAE